MYLEKQARRLHVIIFSAPSLLQTEDQHQTLSSFSHAHTRYLLSRSFFTDKHNTLSLFSEFYFLLFFFSKGNKKGPIFAIPFLSPFYHTHALCILLHSNSSKCLSPIQPFEAQFGISLADLNFSNPNARLQPPGWSSAVAAVVAAVPPRPEQERKLGFVCGEQFHGEIGLYSYVGSFQKARFASVCAFVVHFRNVAVYGFLQLRCCQYKEWCRSCTQAFSSWFCL